ncbi:MAG: TlpA family protein disulfide reductase [Planctomycetes bacterium]|nr:TlpA family protein disulfide reductase [Planctomycetota bacterium]
MSVFVAVLVAGFSSVVANQRPKPGIVNQAAPSWGVTEWINLPEKKTTLDMADFEGKVVYLFCFQSWCPGCHSRGFPTLKKVMSRFADNDDVAFVAIQTVFEGFASNTFDHAKQVARKYELKIPVGQSGKRGKRSHVMVRYRTGGTPWVIIIDRDGMVRYNDFHIGVDRADKLIRAALKTPPAKGKESGRSVPRKDGQ